MPTDIMCHFVAVPTNIMLEYGTRVIIFHVYELCLRDYVFKCQ